MRRAFTMSLLLMWLLAATAGAKEVTLRKYVVKPGDTCWSIALALYGDGEKYKLIHRYNELGPLPHVLTPGTELQLPVAGAAALGKVDWLREEVEAKSPAAVDWRNAEQDMPLWRLYRVRTGDASSAGIEFEDRSHLSMREQALLVVYGSGAGKSRLDRRAKTSVTLEKGGIRGGLAQLDRAAMQVRTASGRVSLASRDTQIEVDAEDTTAVSVYDGKARVSAQGEDVTVKEGEGTTVEKGAPPAKPRPLPKAPGWVGDSGDVVVVVPGGGLGAFSLDWDAVKNAARYRVELALDDTFRRVITDAEVGAGVRRFDARDMSPGTYFVRVSTVDSRKLQSRASETAKVRVVALDTSRALVPDSRGELLAVGWLKVAMPDDASGDVEVAVDGGAFADGNAPLRLYEPGVYKVRFRAKGGQRESVLLIRLLAVKGTLELPAGPQPLSAATVPVTLRLEDERGRPAILPGLSLTSASGGALALIQKSAGEFSADVPAAPGAVEIKAAWLGGLLDDGEIVFEEPAEANADQSQDETPGMQWPIGPMHLSWSGPADSVAARSARPFSHIGISLTTAPAPGDSPDVPQYFRTALAGQIALFDDHMSLDGEIAFFDANLDEDLAGESVLDELRLGIRAWLLRTSRLYISPSFRVALPTSYRVDLTDRFTFEPGFLFDFMVLDNFYLGTNQVFVIRAGDGDTDAEYGATLDGEVRVGQLMGIGAEIGLLVRGQNVDRNDDDIEGASVIGAMSARLYMERFRLGMQVGGGLNKVARRRLGIYSIGLNLDLLLGDD